MSYHAERRQFQEAFVDMFAYTNVPRFDEQSVLGEPLSDEKWTRLRVMSPPTKLSDVLRRVHKTSR